MSVPDDLEGDVHYWFPTDIVAVQRQHPLLERFHITRAGYFRRFAGHLTERPAGFRDSHILIYCVNGQGWYEANDKRWRIEQNQLLLVPRGVAHAYGADARYPWTIYWAHVDGIEADHYLDLLGMSAAAPIMAVSTHQIEIRTWFDKMLSQCHLGHSHIYLIKAAMWLRQILSTLMLEPAPLLGERRQLNIEASIEFMLTHISTTQTVAELARQATLSSSHFSHQFRAKTGYAPIDYFIRLKMQRASELLTTTELAVSEIALLVGYQDPHYFSRLFRQKVGVPPRMYRQEQQAII